MVVIGYLLIILRFALLAAEIYAFVDAARRRTDAFPAAGKLTKPAWLAILAISFAVTFFFGILGGFLVGLAAAVATIVYFVDVKPALDEVTRGGPYGGY